jgi:hypothetical protein
METSWKTADARLALAALIATNLSGWTVLPPSFDNDARTLLLRAEGQPHFDVMLTFNLATEKLSVCAAFDSPFSKWCTPEEYQATQMNSSLDKGAAQLARDIARRVIGPAEELTLKLAQRADAAQQRRSSMLGAMSTLSKALPALRWRTDARQDDEERRGSFNLEGDGGPCDIVARPGSFDLKLSRLSVAQALDILDLLSDEVEGNAEAESEVARQQLDDAGL